MILAFAGKTSSGKTTTATKIAKKLNWKLIGFGGYIRHIAKQKEIVPCRENLQHIGEEEIKKGYDSFCKNVLSFHDWKKGESLVIDGIRHKEVVDSLKNIMEPSDVYLIYINLDNKIREKRSVDHKCETDLQKYDSHSTEEQVVTSLPNISDLILDGSDAVECNVTRIIEWMNKRNDKCSNHS